MRTNKNRHSPRVEIKGVEQTKTSELLRLRKIAMQLMQMLHRIMARLVVPRKKARVPHSSKVAAAGVVTGPKPLQLLTIRSSIIFSRKALKQPLRRRKKLSLILEIKVEELAKEDQITNEEVLPTKTSINKTKLTQVSQTTT